MKSDEAHSAVLKAVAIEPLLIEEEFAAIPSSLARYNELYSEAYGRFLTSKALYDQAWAGAMLRLREESEGKKTTVDALKSMVEIDDDVIAARLHMIECEVAKVRFWGVMDALRAKKDALISIGAHIRAEMGGNPAIREQHRGARDVAASRDTTDDDDD